MFLTKLAIKRPVSTLLLIFTLLVFGISSIFGFKLSQMPNIEMPTYIVITPYLGADPELIDSTVSKEVEAIGATLTGFTESRTISEEGMSTVVFSFDYGIDSNQTYMDIKTALDNLSLPEDASDPIIMEISLGQGAMMNMSVSGPEGEDILGFANDVLVPEIDALLGVAEVKVRGGEEEYISITADPSKMEQYGISLQSISNAISSYDFEVPIGEIENGNQNINISSGSTLESIIDLRDITIATPTGAMIKLSDVALIEQNTKPSDSISRNDGVSDISLSITSANDANIPELTEDIMAELEKIHADYPDIGIEITKNESENIITSLTSVASTLVISVILCMAVLFIFLGNLKASLIVGSSIPLSLIITLICMSLLDFELNMVTTTALIIAIGMMVDNSIVVLESIFKEKQRTSSFKDAAIEGFKTVGPSVIASTITTIVVYVPMTVLGGISGQLFGQLSFVIVFAMLASLVSAMVFIPLFYYLIEPAEKPSPVAKIMEKIENGYDKSIRHVINKRKTVVLASVLLLIGAFSLLLFIPIELIPQMDTRGIVINAEFRSGTDISSIDEQILELEQTLLEDETLTNIITSIDGNTATLEAEIADNTDTADVVDEYLVYTRSLPNMTVTVEQSGSMMGSVGETTLGTVVSGYDYDNVIATSNEIMEDFYRIPGVLSVSSSMGSSGETKAVIDINPEKALRYGMSSAQISSMLRQSVTGITATELNIENKDYSVIIEYPEGVYDDFNSFMNLPITTSGGVIQLNQVAELKFTDSLQTINRTNGIYTVELTAVTTEANEASVANAIKEIEKTTTFANGVEVGEGPGSNMTTEELTAFAGAIATATFLVFIVMAMQFESVRFSFMVMTSIGFCFVGSFALLFVSGQTLSMIGLMGVLMLVGIAVNNAILFVDTANVLKQEMEIKEALVQSGKLRMRPILMTTMTTILSMVPVALGIGEGAEMLQSMGIIIIGGLTASMILVLFLMPTFYLLIDKKEKKDKAKE